MKSFSLLLLAAALLPNLCFAEKKGVPSAPAPAEIGVHNSSLLKVNVTNQSWNFRIPWQKNSPGARRGLGVLMEKNQILVTAQLVADATYIELERAETGLKLSAKVKAVDYEANLALLEPAQAVENFFAGLKPMAVETAVKARDELDVLQLDPRGDMVISKVILSKFVTTRYVLESSLFLAYETNNIIRTEANSFTLPVVKGGKLAGLVLRYDSKNQSATVLPGPIIAHFLKDMADGNYQGFPNLGIEYQTTLDPQFHEYLGLGHDQQGVYVSNVSKGGSAENAGVEKGDIILEMNGHAVDDRGDYDDAQFGKLNVSNLVRGQAFVGQDFKVKVIRAGKEKMLSGKLLRKNPKDYVVWPYLFDRGPNYFVMGGLIFQELSMPFLQSFGEDWESNAPLRLLFIAKHTEEYEKMGKRKIVFLAGSLPTRTTQGYERLGGHVVSKVNGEAINDLSDLAAAFKKPHDGVHKIELEEAPRLVFLDAITAESDNLHLLDGVYRLDSLKRID